MAAQKTLVYVALKIRLPSTPQVAFPLITQKRKEGLIRAKGPVFVEMASGILSPRKPPTEKKGAKPPLLLGPISFPRGALRSLCIPTYTGDRPFFLLFSFAS